MLCSDYRWSTVAGGKENVASGPYVVTLSLPLDTLRLIMCLTLFWALTLLNEHASNQSPCVDRRASVGGGYWNSASAS